MNLQEGRPILKPGCRLSPAGDVVLIPEGALRLEGPASRIIQFCDGTMTIPEIVRTLIEQFPGADPGRVSEETATFLTRLVDRAVIEFI